MSFVIDLSNLTRTQGFVIQGDAAGDNAGRSVSSGGDVNGDGINDLIVGAPFGDDGGTNAGEAYVIYGTSNATRGRIDLTNLTALDGYVIQGDASRDGAASSVTFASDLNGDGIGDLIIGAPFGDDGGVDAGEAYVVYGKTGTTRGPLDLTNLAAADGFVIQGDATGDYAGSSVSSVGDINGDEINDLIVGAPLGDDGGTNAGEAYVIYGKSGATRGRLDLSNLIASDGFIIRGDAERDYSSGAVSLAGDVNGDGIDDLIIGAPNNDGGGENAGAAYVVYGILGATRGNVDLTTITSADGFVIQGDAALNSTGNVVSSAGDLNGDGIDDFVVCAAFGDTGGIDAGEVYVVYGRSGQTRDLLNLAELSASDGFVIHGDRPYDNLGWSASSAGDVNGDGLDDIIIGASKGDDGGDGAGEAYVIYGKSGKTRGSIDLAFFTSTDGFIIRGDAVYDQAGTAVSAAGDVNGDGFDDVIVGAPFGNDGGVDAGEAYVIYGFSRISGAATADRLTGTALRDTILGLGGNDALTGGAGNDELIGGAGRDRLTGGAGRDEFEFTTMRDMTTRDKATDVITDFRRGQDKIDLSDIDASTRLAGENAFLFKGIKPFATSAQGEIYTKKFDLAGRSKDYTLVYIDTDGDRAAEGVIKVMGLHNFTAGDFIL